MRNFLLVRRLYPFCTGFGLTHSVCFMLHLAASSKQLMEAGLRHTHSAVSITLSYSLFDFTSFWLLPLEAPPLCLLTDAQEGRELTPAVRSGRHSLPRDSVELRGHQSLLAAGNVFFPEDRYRKNFGTGITSIYAKVFSSKHERPVTRGINREGESSQIERGR